MFTIEILTETFVLLCLQTVRTVLPLNMDPSVSIRSSYIDIIDTASLISVQTHKQTDSQSPLSVATLHAGVKTQLSKDYLQLVWQIST